MTVTQYQQGETSRLAASVVSSPRGIAMRLGFVVLCLTLASIAGTFARYFLGHGGVLGLVHAFDLNGERNIPTWYAASSLLVCSILLATIAQAKKVQGDRYTLHWSALALIFVCLSLDEAISIHEPFGMLFQYKPEAQGFLYYVAWVIPGAAFALIMFLFYLRFLTALPPRTRYLFLVAGMVYVVGTIGMETVGASFLSRSGEPTFMYAMMYTIEEFLEMVGILVFIYALLSYMKSERVQVLF